MTVFFSSFTGFSLWRHWALRVYIKSPSSSVSPSVQDPALQKPKLFLCLLATYFWCISFRYLSQSWNLKQRKSSDSYGGLKTRLRCDQLAFRKTIVCLSIENKLFSANIKYRKWFSAPDQKLPSSTLLEAPRLRLSLSLFLSLFISVLFTTHWLFFSYATEFDWWAADCVTRSIRIGRQKPHCFVRRLVLIDPPTHTDTQTHRPTPEAYHSASARRTQVSLNLKVQIINEWFFFRSVLPVLGRDL